jgi:thiosulfate dehydrogenase (quinone) large subunit
MTASSSALLRYATWAIVAVAGVWTAFHIVWSLTGNTGRDYWGTAMIWLFLVGVVVAFMRFFEDRASLVGSIPSTEQFPEPAISRFFLGTAGASGMWFVVRMYVGAEWLVAGAEKVQSGFGAAGIKGFALGALAKATGAHPAVQDWYASFLKNFVIPNAGLFAFTVTWGEVAVGLGVLIGALTGIAAGFGVLMNLNYLLAGTVSTNPVLGVLGLFLVMSWRVAGWIGVDRWLLPALGLPWKPGAWFGGGTARIPQSPVSHRAPA